jgi:predicted enzyme related to lactoylglutathione lyase
MKVKGIDFVFFRVSDLKRSVHFYEKVIGLKKTNEYKGMWTEFDAGNVTIAVGTCSEEKKPALGKNSVSVALAVDNVEKAVETLKKKGALVVQPVKERGVCFVAMIKDPDGNELILHKRKDNTVG